MLAYVTLGSNDTARALEFYDALMPTLGASRVFDNGRLYFYSAGQGQPMLAVGGTYDEKEATCGNGVMVSLGAPDRETVDKVYAKAIELGATDDGEPGERVPNFFYGAYFRDPDGHKICVCKMGA
jgi:catechol 2,3-dioxygenase-like lactoylglutathione lyase family enzyme